MRTHNHHLVLGFCLAAAAFGQTRRDTSQYTVGSSVQPLVIYGEGWSQQFTIINVDYYQGGESTVGTVRFFTKDGQPWRIPIKGRGSVDQIAVHLRSGQMTSFETEVSDVSQQLGWAQFSVPIVSGQSGIYHAFTTFRKQTPGRADLMTAVPFVDGLEDEFIVPFDNRDGKFPGVGLVNTDSRAVVLTVRAYDESGNLRRTFSRSIPPFRLDWFSLLGEYPELSGFTGQLKVTGGLFQTAAFTLQFAGNGAFTALPVVHTYGQP